MNISQNQKYKKIYKKIKKDMFARIKTNLTVNDFLQTMGLMKPPNLTTVVRKRDQRNT